LRVGESRQLDPDEAGGSTNPGGKLNPRIGQPPGFVPVKRELPTNVYRWDASGKLEVVVTEEQVPDPNGILFSPDHKKLYVISTGKGPGDTGPGGKGVIYVFDVGVDNKLSNQKLFTDCVVDGVKCGPDGMRCDVNGNVWCSSNAGRAIGYSGVTVWSRYASEHVRTVSPRMSVIQTKTGSKRPWPSSSARRCADWSMVTKLLSILGKTAVGNVRLPMKPPRWNDDARLQT
jgi:hypothetical protein